MNYNYILCKYNSDLILIMECFKNNTYYRIDFKIENNLKIVYFTSDRKKQDTIEYEFSKNKITDEKDILKIDSEITIKFENGENIKFNIKKEFNKSKEIYTSRYDAIDKLDDEFTIKYINDLIKTGQLFANHKFIIDNAENLFKLIKSTEKKQVENQNIKIEQKMKIEKIIKYASEFFKENKIDIDINELIKNKVIEFENPKENNNSHGKSYFDKETKQKLINVVNNNNLLTLAVLVHEIMHYLNQPNDDNRNETSEFLTEAISYSIELILIDKFLETEYKNDALYIMKKTLYSSLKAAYYSYSPILSICIYKNNEEKITKEKIEEFLKFEIYKKEMQEFIKNRSNLSFNIWNLIGYYLAIYNYIEYKKDSKHIEKIKELNNNINEKTFEECLKIIDIDNFQELIEKGLNNIDEYINKFFEKKVKNI